MKNTLSFIILFTVAINIFNAQGSNSYSKVVNNAERAITNKENAKALSHYEELKKEKYIFSREIYNALICANKAKRWEEVNYWGKLFLEKGASLRFFNQRKFDEYRGTLFFEKLKRLQIKNSVNQQLIKSLDSLTRTDQNLFVKLKQDPNTKVYNLTEEIDKKLFFLEKKYGKISEENTGINLRNDTIYSSRPSFVVLYRHSYQSHLPNSYFNVKSKNNELERILYYNSMDYNLMPIIEHKNILYYLKEDFLQLEYKNDFINFLEITRKAYRNKDFSDYSFYYPIARIDSFANDESAHNFEKMLKEFYVE
ncbi:hypothetical protein OMO38_03735 [Chryseobacterium sp. 09-1422]|uniref:YARHG domain-containing protein n=1 Tax=Chryseobacterium kimseyorum TaxID=2984028 RepID=A0ABT3HV10_9FLAO|nr:hypothetical protein [Chryseobacterium kimseyorum]MCW3167631.1 hypothetical protein [Chryseobacterium kimseyorum]